MVSLRIVDNLLAGIGLSNKPKLLQNSQAPFLSNLANNLAILERENGDSREMNLLASVGFVKLPHNQIVKGTASMRATANPLGCDIVALCNQGSLVRPECQIRESLIFVISVLNNLKSLLGHVFAFNYLHKLG